MKYLLDTHIFLWSIFSPEKIGKEIKDILLDSNYEKYISSISFLEISIKYAIGKLKLNGTNPEEVYKKSIESGYNHLEIKGNEFSSFYKLPFYLNHKDPFDRLIIWQCLLNNIILLTNDAEIKSYTQLGLQLIQN